MKQDLKGEVQESTEETLVSHTVVTKKPEKPKKPPKAKPQEEKPAKPIDLDDDDEDEQGLKGLFNKMFKKKKKPTSSPMLNVERFQTSAQEGLSYEQVETRISQGLVNSNQKKFSKTYKSIFIGNICTFFNFLCLMCACLLLLARAPITQYVFVAIFLCNIGVSIFQEIRAKRKIDKLSILSSPTAKVVRYGEKMDISVDQIVVDDVLLLTAGQQIPTDCIAMEGNVEVNESLLTGESVPIKKEPGEQLYAGSFIASGQVAARVDKIGDQTYISRLTARAKKYKRPNSEIMNSINLFIKIIGILIVPVAIFMFITNFKAFGGNWVDFGGALGFIKALFNGNPVLNETIQKTCSVIIGMIPSGLLLLTTIALSVGIVRLAKYNTLVQDMYSLEMLARVNVLCLDKTGTITDGRMKVSDCILVNNGTGSEHSIDDIIGSMLASLSDNNQTSIALYERFGYSAALQPIATLPFSSARKLSAVTFRDEGTYVLGAPEFVLKPVPARIDKMVKMHAQMGLRVLVIAHSPSGIQGDKAPAGLKPIAVITLSDNIRPDAIETIKWFRENDVEVKVISGDNPVTVSEVARRAGVKNAAQFISLEGLSNLDVENAANQYTVFGRVTPEQKAILIRAIKKSGNTVAMTGDGVNDILAMKEADCAVSVASGSEAARNVSNIVLQDNNFGSMPKIVNEGRRVINNIKNSSSLYIMKTLLTLLLAVTCIILRSKYFFTTNNMMMFELFVSSIPSFVLSLQPNTNRVKGKFIPYVLSRSIPGALTMGLAIISLYVLHLTPIADNLSLRIGGVETLEYQAMMMLALTFSGLVMLYRICQPFNVLRSVMYTIVTVLVFLVLSIPFCGGIVFTDWNLVKFTLPQVLIMIIIVQASFPISGFLIKWFARMSGESEPEEKEEKKEKEKKAAK
ncbi:MAG: HAD-IC family P-type ATPase [Clostridia bacterium]|nr:HAD-IC family P-type ATPase [Clostridia bacterium]